MSAGNALTAEELRPLLREKIDAIDARTLNAVHRFLLRMELEEVSEQLVASFSNEENLSARIDAAVAEFRKAHPYR